MSLKHRKGSELLFREVNTCPNSSCLCSEIPLCSSTSVCGSAPLQTQRKRNKLAEIVWTKLSGEDGSEPLWSLTAEVVVRRCSIPVLPLLERKDSREGYQAKGHPRLQGCDSAVPEGLEEMK